MGQGSEQGGSPIDDRGPDPLRVIYGDPLLLFGSSSPGDPLAKDIYGLGGRPALRDPYGASAAGRPLEPACRDQGKVIFAGSTLRLDSEFWLMVREDVKSVPHVRAFTDFLWEHVQGMRAQLAGG